MSNYDLLIENNFSSFKDLRTNQSVFIDSFDNEKFYVRIGSARSSKDLGSVCAYSSEELNKKVEYLLNSEYLNSQLNLSQNSATYHNNLSSHKV